MTTRVRIPALDGVRGLAILLVLAHNFDLTGDRINLISWGLKYGWVGVQLFFVLSGFLITGILLDTRDHPHYFRNFLLRRTRRIFPLYYTTLAIAFLAFATHDNQIWLWTYVINWLEPFGYGVAAFPHFWSLAVEEQFYLVWPVVVRFCSMQRLKYVCCALMFIALFLRIVVRATLGAEATYMFTVCRMDALACGALVAIYARSRDPRRSWLIAIFAATMILTPLLTRGAPRTGVLTQSLGYTLLAVGFSALVLYAAKFPTRLLSFGWLRALGQYSYAMYVFHSPLHLLFGRRLVERITGHAELSLLGSLAYTVAATSVTLIAAIVSYHVIEKRFLASTNPPPHALQVAA